MAAGRDADFPEVRWHGHWIAPDLPDFRPAGISFAPELPPAEFSRSQYRREFALAEVPARVPARLTADSRYVLWVNGVEVGRGPIRSQPRRLRYDDVRPRALPARGHEQHRGAGHLLRLRELVLAAGRRRRGRWAGMRCWSSRRSSARLTTTGSSPTTAGHATRATAWGSVPHGGLDGVPVELLDAREIDPGWTNAGFDDAGWIAASVMKVGHQGGFAGSQPPTDPFGALLPRGIGALGGDTVLPVEPDGEHRGRSRRRQPRASGRPRVRGAGRPWSGRRGNGDAAALGDGLRRDTRGRRLRAHRRGLRRARARRSGRYRRRPALPGAAVQPGRRRARLGSPHRSAVHRPRFRRHLLGPRGERPALRQPARPRQRGRGCAPHRPARARVPLPDGAAPRSSGRTTPSWIACTRRASAPSR